MDNIAMHIVRLLLSAVCLSASSQLAAGPIDDLADQTWTQVDSKHFRIVTDQPEATARLMLNDLESLRYISTRVRGVETLDAVPPLTILAIGKDSNFRRIGMREQVGGMFNISRDGYNALANVSGYVSSTEESSPARTILLHEYHHFLMRLTPRTLAMPRWYDEGMAEYWSSLTIQDGMAKFGQPVDGMGREYAMFNPGGTMRVDTKTLFNQRDFKWNDTYSDNDAIARFYAQARYTVHYFLSTKELRAQLDRYIALYNQGISQDRAAQLAFTLPYAELDKEIVRYLRRKMVVRGYKIGKDGLDFPEIKMTVSTLTRKATWSVFAEVLPRYVHKDQKLVRTLLETNRQLNPDSPDAYRHHLRYLGGSGQPPLTELLQRYPRHPGLHAAHGEMLRIHGEAMREAGVEGWVAHLQAARLAYLRAYQLDPSQALAYSGLGEIHYALPGKEGLDDGLAAMDTAVIYERSPEAFRKLARMHLRAGNLEDALAAMRAAVAFHDEAQADPLDVALQENLELLMLPKQPTPSAGADGLRWPDGSSYTGEVRKGLPHGAGRYTRLGGSSFEGRFEDGLPHGPGKLVSERGLSFEGVFERGVARGPGRLSMAGGGALISYEGQVEHMLPSGSGVLVDDIGRYEGQLHEGLPHGTGTLTAAAGGSKLSGIWRYGLFDFPALDQRLFTGAANARGERTGSGWCRPVDQPGALAPCSYHDGKLVD